MIVVLFSLTWSEECSRGLNFKYVFVSIFRCSRWNDSNVAIAVCQQFRRTLRKRARRVYLSENCETASNVATFQTCFYLHLVTAQRGRPTSAGTPATAKAERGPAPHGRLESQPQRFSHSYLTPDRKSEWWGPGVRGGGCLRTWHGSRGRSVAMGNFGSACRRTAPVCHWPRSESWNPSRAPRESIFEAVTRKTWFWSGRCFERQRRLKTNRTPNDIFPPHIHRKDTTTSCSLLDALITGTFCKQQQHLHEIQKQYFM